MAVPSANQINQAVPADGVPSRPLTNALLIDFRTNLNELFAAVSSGGMQAATYDPGNKAEQVLTIGDASDFAPASHSHTIGQVTGLQTALDDKAGSVHTHTVSQITDFNAGFLSRVTADAAAIATAVAGVTNVNLLTDAQVSKLDNLEGSKYLGTYTNLSALNTAHPSPAIGSYAHVDAGPGSSVQFYIWDDDDDQFVLQQGSGGSETGASIKTKLFAEPDTNNLTDVLFTRLNSVQNGATANDTDSNLRDRSTHTGTITSSVVSNFNASVATRIGAEGAAIKTALLGEVNTNTLTDAQVAKLDNIANGATANDTDSNLRDRSTHTGTQPASTISDFNAAFSARVTAESSALKTSILSNANTNFLTDEQVTKLNDLESSKFLGLYTTLSALNTAHPSPAVGSYAYVDAGVSSAVQHYIWDDDDDEFVLQQGSSTAETGASIKTKLFSETDTNNYDDEAKGKVDALPAGGPADVGSNAQNTIQGNDGLVFYDQSASDDEKASMITVDDFITDKINPAINTRIAASSVKALSDVQDTDYTNGQVPVWNESNSRFEPGTVAADTTQIETDIQDNTDAIVVLADQVDGLQNTTTVRIASTNGASTRQQFLDAVTATPDGGILDLDGVAITINASTTISEGGDAEIKNMTILAKGAKFVSTANGATVSFQGGITTPRALDANYVIGNDYVDVDYTGATLADEFAAGKIMKVVSDAIDPWNLNEGTATTQWRLGEWKRIHRVEDQGSSVARVYFSGGLKYPRGLNPTASPSAEARSEVETYTTTNNARVFTCKHEDFALKDCHFYTENAAAQITDTVGAWEFTLLEIFGFDSAVLENVEVGPGVGSGMIVAGYAPKILNCHAHDLPNIFQLQQELGFGSSNPGWLGYGVKLGCAYGAIVENLRGAETRHLVDSGSQKTETGFTDYRQLLRSGPCPAVRVKSITAEGGYQCQVATHQDAREWVFESPTINGTRGDAAINLRGPGHKIIAPIINDSLEAIAVFTEFQDDGGVDLPGPSGNGNEYMSSVRVSGAGSLKSKALSLKAQNAYMTIDGCMDMTNDAHNAFEANGGVIDFAGGRSTTKITGDRYAATLNGEATGTARGIFEVGNPSTDYGITWPPGAIIRQGAALYIDASDAADQDTDTNAVSMRFARDPDQSGLIQIDGVLDLKGNSGFDITPFSQIDWKIGNGATFTHSNLVGNTSGFWDSHPPVWQGQTEAFDVADDSAVYIGQVQTNNTAATGARGERTALNIYAQDGTTMYRAEFYGFQSPSSGSDLRIIVDDPNDDFEHFAGDLVSSGQATDGKIGIGYADGVFTLENRSGGEIDYLYVVFRHFNYASDRVL